jgi:phospholipase C
MTAMPHNRRTLLKAAAGFAAFPAIARALDIPAKVRTGTIKDVEHIVILMQENRSFDHYFGAMNGVQGFGDRFPIPVAHDRTVFAQPREEDKTRLIAPFALNTAKDFRLMRVEGTPHSFKDAQAAWDQGRMDNWPAAKHNHSLGYFTREDMPFQYALADAFTLCDAYFCSMHSGTNPNRVFHWTGKNVGPNGPVIDNGYDDLKADPKGYGGYDWTTYPERLSAADVSWQVYQDMKDNFTDNPLVGFKTYRAADIATSGKLAELAKRSVRTRDLDKLKEDVLSGKLPQVSWIVGTAEGSEHPSTSSPAQGADYTAKVLDALTANPDVWAKTVFLINFDENDGYFDHVPPPAPPSLDADGKPLGFAEGAEQEYHQGDDKYRNRPYGLGPRVPMYVISPWSKGGYVASEVFDHTSVIRFIEARFGVFEPNISAWRRAVCGDLTSCFDFKTPNDQPFFGGMPQTTELADRARKLGRETKPQAPDALIAPLQEQGLRKRRATPYALGCGINNGQIVFTNNSHAGAAVFHVYDMDNLAAIPRRFTVSAGKAVAMPLKDTVNLWISGPNGFHRRLEGKATFTCEWGPKGLELRNLTNAPLTVIIRDEAYNAPAQTIALTPQETRIVKLDLAASHNWYDLSLATGANTLRLSGHIEDGKSSMSDPAAFGPAPLII